MSYTSTPQYRGGKRDEEMVCNELQARGWFVRSTDGPERRAPMYSRLRERIILPDFDCCGSGVRCWLEVKGKGTSPVSRMQYCEQVHGIEEPNWNHYIRVQAETATPVFIAVYERDTGLVLCRSLTHLLHLHNDHPYIGMNKGRGGTGPMVYLRRATFHVLFDMNEPRVDGTAILKEAGEAFIEDAYALRDGPGF